MPGYRYIAFDEDLQIALAHDGRAVYALQKADMLDSEARIFIIDAGVLGPQIWRRKLRLSQAEALILEKTKLMRQSLEVPA